MKLFVNLIATLLFFAVTQQSDVKLQIGAKLNQKYIPRKATKQILTSPGQTRPFIKQQIDGVEYIIAFDEKSHWIRYIHTADKGFVTENGLRVGSRISIAKDEIVTYPGWEIRGPRTPDGWYPVVGYDLPKVGAPSEDIHIDSNNRVSTITGFSKGGN